MVDIEKIKEKTWKEVDNILNRFAQYKMHPDDFLTMRIELKVLVEKVLKELGTENDGFGKEGRQRGKTPDLSKGTMPASPTQDVKSPLNRPSEIPQSREELFDKVMEELGIRFPDVMCGTCFFSPKEVAKKSIDLALASSEKQFENQNYLRDWTPTQVEWEKQRNEKMTKLTSKNRELAEENLSLSDRLARIGEFLESDIANLKRLNGEYKMGRLCEAEIILEKLRSEMERGT